LPKPGSGEVWVVNASPVISLAKAGGLALLPELAEAVFLPEPVAEEILAGSPADPARRALEERWLQRASPAGVPDRILEWGLGAGESAVLALVLERPGCTAVLDDAAARTCARALGLPLLGTLGIVLRARRAGLIPSAAQLLRSLRQAGLYLDDGILRETLARVGETWP
jgi:predicted nucleic acid-binding protein